MLFIFSTPFWVIPHVFPFLFPLWVFRWQRPLRRHMSIQSINSFFFWLFLFPLLPEESLSHVPFLPLNFLLFPLHPSRLLPSKRIVLFFLATTSFFPPFKPFSTTSFLLSACNHALKFRKMVPLQLVPPPPPPSFRLPFFLDLATFPWSLPNVSMVFERLFNLLCHTWVVSLLSPGT